LEVETETEAAPALRVLPSSPPPVVAIPNQDLAAHHAPLAEPLVEAFRRVLASGRYVSGDAGGEVGAFEREAARLLGTSHAIGMSSGTDALMGVLMAIGVGPGDAVVTTPFSFVATADVVVRLGARPVFADVDPVTFNLEPEAACAAIGPETRAVVGVHLFGRPCDGAGLRAVCEPRGVSLIEDAAQAVGAIDTDGRPVGAIGRAAALSFFPSKNLGALGDAGMVLTDDGALAATLRRLRTHGAGQRFVHQIIGGNFRMDELQAAVLRVKLPLLQTWNAARRRLASLYRERLASLPLGLPPDDVPGAVWNQFVVRVPRIGAGVAHARDALADALARDGVATAVYYPTPLHLQPCFASLGYRRGDFPVAERACDEVLALPIYPELGPTEVERIAERIARHFSRSSR
jgi:dTDP-4-amino-4,6-dideoxygalactose transaminase